MEREWPKHHRVGSSRQRTGDEVRCIVEESRENGSVTTTRMVFGVLRSIIR